MVPSTEQRGRSPTQEEAVEVARLAPVQIHHTAPRRRQVHHQTRLLHEVPRQRLVQLQRALGAQRVDVAAESVVGLSSGEGGGMANEAAVHAVAVRGDGVAQRAVLEVQRVAAGQRRLALAQHPSPQTTVTPTLNRSGC